MNIITYSTEGNKLTIINRIIEPINKTTERIVQIVFAIVQPFLGASGKYTLLILLILDWIYIKNDNNNNSTIKSKPSATQNVKSISSILHVILSSAFPTPDRIKYKKANQHGATNFSPKHLKYLSKIENNQKFVIGLKNALKKEFILYPKLSFKVFQ